jgi:hypothetical protein
MSSSTITALPFPLSNQVKVFCFKPLFPVAIARSVVNIMNSSRPICKRFQDLLFIIDGEKRTFLSLAL